MAVCVGLFSAGTGLAQESDAKDPAYQQLQRALEAHQKLAKKQEGGWPSIPPQRPACWLGWHKKWDLT